MKCNPFDLLIRFVNESAKMNEALEKRNNSSQRFVFYVFFVNDVLQHILDKGLRF